MRRLLKDVEWRQVAALAALALAVLVFWDTRAVYPLKILVVFFHEISHGLAAVLTGGSVERIEVVEQIGGVTWTRGGSRFVVLTAGYLGSLAWGGAILLLSARTRWDRYGAIALGALLVVMSLWLVRPLVSFGFGFGMATGLALIASGVWLSVDVNELVLRIVGLSSCLYAVFDIKDDILDRPEIPSDARMLADYTGVPTLVWGVVWILIALAASALLLLWACKRRTPGRAR